MNIRFVEPPVGRRVSFLSVQSLVHTSVSIPQRELSGLKVHAAIIMTPQPYEPAVSEMGAQAARVTLRIDRGENSIAEGAFEFSEHSQVFYPHNLRSFWPALSLNASFDFTVHNNVLHQFLMPVIDIQGKPYLGFSSDLIRREGTVEEQDGRLVVSIPQSCPVIPLAMPIEQLVLQHDNGGFDLLAEEQSQGLYAEFKGFREDPTIGGYFGDFGIGKVSLQIRNMFLSGIATFTQMHLVHGVNLQDGSRVMQIRIVQ